MFVSGKETNVASSETARLSALTTNLLYSRL
jgi:hypothetical protein